MAPIDPKNTDRLFVDYVSHGVEHSVMFRKQTADTQAGLIAWAQSFLGDLNSIFDTTVSFHSARYALQNSNVTNPVAWTPIAGSGAVQQAGNGRPWFGSFVGRDAQGHRVKIGFYGVSFGDDANYRILTTDSAAIESAVDLLNSLTSAAGTIVGSKPVWKPYMNLGYNAYWQRQVRVIG